MAKRKYTLITDALVNLVLGVLLLAYSPSLARTLGVPVVQSGFYPGILGAVFTGISIALLLEAFRSSKAQATGLGLLGAISINLCGGMALFIWLLSGKLDIPVRGLILLWALAVLLLVLSGIELLLHFKPGKTSPS